MDDLRHLFGAYFYELWDEYEYQTWEAATDDFVRRSPERAARVPDQVDEMLRDFKTDEALDAHMVAMDCTYRAPEGDRAWLEAVRDRIAAAVSG